MDVCMDSAEEWRACLGRITHIPLQPASETVCFGHQDAFNACVLDWRENKGGGQQKVKGLGQGEAPPQCIRIAGDWECCMAENKYDMKACAYMMRAFKSCVKTMYLSEYVTE
eukprot:PhM_4_TR12389/c0_g1_i1/m.61650